MQAAMRIETTDSPTEEDEAYVIARLRGYNDAHSGRDFRPLCVFARDASDATISGLIGKIYFGRLEEFPGKHERYYLTQRLHA